MSKGSSDSKTKSTSEPWKESVPYLKEIMSGAKGAYGSGAGMYPDQMFAPMSDLENRGLTSMAGYATGLLPQQVWSAQNAWGDALNAPDVANNPYVWGMMDANTGLLNRNLQEELIPTARLRALGSGVYGDSGQYIAEGIAQRGTQDAISRGNQEIMGTAYGQGLGARSQAMSMAPDMLKLGLMPGQIMRDVGAAGRGEEQRYLDESIGRYDWSQGVPWDLLNRYKDVINPMAGQGGTSVGTSSQPNNNNGLWGAVGAIGSAMIGSPRFF